MLNKLTQTALVLVLGVVIVWGSYLLFQQWHDTVLPTEGEVATLMHSAVSRVDFDEELATWNRKVETAANIEIAGWIVMGVEIVLAVGLLLVVITRPTPADIELETDEVAEMRRAFQN